MSKGCPSSATFVCPYCSKSFAGSFTLKRHIKNVHGPKDECFKFSCDVCYKSFYRQDNLVQHKSTAHKSVKKFYTCQKCHESFKWRQQFKRHKLLQSCPKAQKQQSSDNYKQYKCSIDDCDTSFTSKYAFKRHWRCKHKLLQSCPIAQQQSFDNDKQYKCSVDDCDTSFTSKYALKRHQRCKHNIPSEHTVKPMGSETHLCEYCGKLFENRSTVTHHHKFCSMKIAFGLADTTTLFNVSPLSLLSDFEGPGPSFHTPQHPCTAVNRSHISQTHIDKTLTHELLQLITSMPMPVSDVFDQVLNRYKINSVSDFSITGITEQTDAQSGIPCYELGGRSQCSTAAMNTMQASSCSVDQGQAILQLVKEAHSNGDNVSENCSTVEEPTLVNIKLEDTSQLLQEADLSEQRRVPHKNEVFYQQLRGLMNSTADIDSSRMHGTGNLTLLSRHITDWITTQTEGLQKPALVSVMLSVLRNIGVIPKMAIGIKPVFHKVNDVEDSESC